MQRQTVLLSLLCTGLVQSSLGVPIRLPAGPQGSVTIRKVPVLDCRVVRVPGHAGRWLGA